jgi:hypothetical protein
MPAKRPLDQYSRDEDRAYAFERDRLEQRFNEAQVHFDLAVGAIDGNGPLDQDYFDTAVAALATIRDVAAQAKNLQGSDEERAELGAFASALRQSAHIGEKSLEHAHGIGKRLQDQAQREALLRSNKERGLPWNHGLTQDQLTAEDVEAMGGYDAVFPDTGPQNRIARSLHKMKLQERSHYFNEAPGRPTVAAEMRSRLETRAGDPLRALQVNAEMKTRELTEGL